MTHVVADTTFLKVLLLKIEYALMHATRRPLSIPTFGHIMCAGTGVAWPWSIRRVRAVVMSFFHSSLYKAIEWTVQNRGKRTIEGEWNVDGAFFFGSVLAIVTLSI